MQNKLGNHNHTIFRDMKVENCKKMDTRVNSEKMCQLSDPFLAAEFPKDLPENSQEELGVTGGEIQSPDEAADFFRGQGGRLRDGFALRTSFHVAAGV